MADQLLIIVKKNKDLWCGWAIKTEEQIVFSPRKEWRNRQTKRTVAHDIGKIFCTSIHKNLFTKSDMRVNTTLKIPIAPQNWILVAERRHVHSNFIEWKPLSHKKRNWDTVKRQHIRIQLNPQWGNWGHTSQRCLNHWVWRSIQHGSPPPASKLT